MSIPKDVKHLEIPLEDILLATNAFSKENIIAKGGFGVVYQGQSEQHGMIAIKQLDRKLGQGNHEFMMEIALLSIYKHENIVSLIGFCSKNEEKVLIYKHEKNGSLDKHLENKDLTWIKRLQICLDAACGLKYLHDDVGPQHRIIHRDIKSSNILLDENWKAKISDFGLSKVGPANVEHTFLISNVCGTPGYVDPEYVNGILTKKSDVYSFGVVLFEVLCGRLACVPWYKDKRRILSDWGQYHYENQTLDEIVDSDLRKQMESASLSVFSSIAYKCLKKHGEERPIMSEVVEQIKKALDYQLYPADAHRSEKHSSGHSAAGNSVERIRFRLSPGDKAKVSGTSLILSHVHKNDLSAVRKLLEEDGSLVHARDYNSQTPLHVASFHGCIEVAKCLIEYGADVNAQDRWHNTPLAEAEGAGKHGMIGLLKSYGGLSYGPNEPRFVPPSLPSNHDWEINPSELDFSDSCLIGKGSFGEIIKAGWCGTPVAVKRIVGNLAISSQDFKREVDLLVKLHHPNIVQFLGAVTKKKPFMLLTEYLQGGDLHQFMKEKGALSPTTAVKFALDIARGMAYLHNEPNVIVHRDLNPSNVFIVNSNAEHLKVGNFGLSHPIRVEHSHDIYKLDGEIGSYRYMAPEVFKHRKYDKKVDVFSFGMMLYEMLEGEPPFSHYEAYEAAKYIAEGHRPLFRAKGYVLELRELTELCWAADMNRRPSFLEILRRLESLNRKNYKNIRWFNFRK